MQLSFKSKTILGIALIESSLLIVLIWSSLTILYNSNEEEFYHRASSIANLFAVTTKDAIISTDLASLESFVTDILENPSIVYARVRNTQKVLSQKGEEEIIDRNFVEDDDLANVDDGVYDISRIVSENGFVFGSIEIGISSKQLNDIMLTTKRRLITIAIIEIILVALFSYMLGTFLTKQLKNLQKATKKISQGGVGYQLHVNGRDEIAQTIMSFNEMSLKLKSMQQKEQVALQTQNLKSEELSSVLRNIPEGVVYINELGNIQGINPAAVDIFGYNENELRGRNVSLLLPYQYFQGSLANVEEFILKYILAAVECPKEITAIKKSGEKVPLALSMNEIVTHSGRVLICMVKDITEQKRTQKKIEDLARFPEENPNPVIRFDRNFEVLYSNISGAELLSEYERLNSAPLSDIIHRNYLAEIQRGERVLVEIDTKSNVYMCTVVPLMESGYINMYAADITKLKKYQKEMKVAKEEAVSANQEKSRFLATMSHEIRTPLNATLGILSLLCDTNLSDKQIRFVETGLQSGEALLAIINDILDFSKIEAGELTLEKEQFKLNDLISNSVEIMATKAFMKKIEIAYSITGEYVSCLEGDTARIKQVLLNLISNAIKFTEDGGVGINVSQTRVSNNEVDLRFDVKDSGIGIHKNKLNRLFSEFSQVDNTTTRRYEGTGLGLAISRKLVSKMGGEIGVESVFGEGSNFWFTCRLKISDSTVKNDIQSLQGNCLWLSNNEVIRKNVTEILATFGFCVDAPETESLSDFFKTNLVKSRLGKYKLVIIDDSLDISQIHEKLIKQAHVSLLNSKLVLLTKSSEDFAILDPFTKLTKLIVQKPINFEIFEHSLRDFLGINPKESIKVSDNQSIRSQECLTVDSLRILLVEDSAANVIVAKTMLENGGHKVEVAGNGLEAIEMVCQFPYDLVLMDMMMPEMDGVEATKQIRCIERLNPDLPIIAMTANATEEDRNKCISAGMDGFITKPISKLELFSTIFKFFKTKNAA